LFLADFVLRYEDSACRNPKLPVPLQHVQQGGYFEINFIATSFLSCCSCVSWD